MLVTYVVTCTSLISEHADSVILHATHFPIQLFKKPFPFSKLYLPTLHTVLFGLYGHHQALELLYVGNFCVSVFYGAAFFCVCPHSMQQCIGLQPGVLIHMGVHENILRDM
jgi:hypothetical protein